MLTPQQIQDISFEKALFGGYDMDSVDDILEPLTEDYVTLYKENSVLKSKMRILVEKLEEYRKQEASMQNALLAAQKTCDQMVADAEKKCAQMLHEAEDAASAKTNNVDALVGEEQERLDAAKAATSQFLDGMEKRLKRQLELIDELRRETPLTPSQPEEPERVHRFTPPVEPQTPVLTPKEQPKEPSHNRAYDYEAEQSHPSAEEKADALIEEIGQQIEQSLSGSTLGDIAQEDHSGDTRKLDTLHGFPVSKKFEDLQFGRNYDPKKRQESLYIRTGIEYRSSDEGDGPAGPARSESCRRMHGRRALQGITPELFPGRAMCLRKGRRPAPVIAPQAPPFRGNRSGTAEHASVS